MASNRGKPFEQKFKQDMKKSIPGIDIERLYDSMSGFVAVSNISDFIAYNYPNMFYLECKSCMGNTFNFKNLTQYDKLKEKVGIKGIRTGVVLWFRDHDKVWYIPIKTITKMKEDNKKSLNVYKSIEEGYRIIEIPTTVKRVYPESNYSCLLNLEEGD